MLVYYFAYFNDHTLPVPYRSATSPRVLVRLRIAAITSGSPGGHRHGFQDRNASAPAPKAIRRRHSIQRTVGVVPAEANSTIGRMYPKRKLRSSGLTAEVSMPTFMQRIDHNDAIVPYARFKFRRHAPIHGGRNVADTAPSAAHWWAVSDGRTGPITLLVRTRCGICEIACQCLVDHHLRDDGSQLTFAAMDGVSGGLSSQYRDCRGVGRNVRGCGSG